MQPGSPGDYSELNSVDDTPADEQFGLESVATKRITPVALRDHQWSCLPVIGLMFFDKLRFHAEDTF